MVEERPDCPYCDRELSPNPVQAGIGWKCVQHGPFPAAEFDASPINALEDIMTGTNSNNPSDALWIGVGWGCISILLGLSVWMFDLPVSGFTHPAEAAILFGLFSMAVGYLFFSWTREAAADGD